MKPGRHAIYFFVLFMNCGSGKNEFMIRRRGLLMFWWMVKRNLLEYSVKSGQTFVGWVRVDLLMVVDARLEFVKIGLFIQDNRLVAFISWDNDDGFIRFEGFYDFPVGGG